MLLGKKKSFEAHTLRIVQIGMCTFFSQFSDYIFKNDYFLAISIFVITWVFDFSTLAHISVNHLHSEFQKDIPKKRGLERKKTKINSAAKALQKKLIRDIKHDP